MLESLATILTANLPILYAIYGLAFFTVSLSVILAPREPSIPHVGFLAAFTFLQSLDLWGNILIMAGVHVSDAFRLVFSAAAGYFLLEFGARLLSGAYAPVAWASRVPVGLGVLYVLALVGIDMFVTPSFEIATAQTLARYMLLNPGYLLAGAAMFIASWRGKLQNPPAIQRAARGMAIGFVVKAILGVVVPHIPTSSLLMAMGTQTGALLPAIPGVFFRVCTAVAIAGFFISMQRIWAAEREKGLAASEQRNRELVEQATQSAKQYRYIFDSVNDAVFIHPMNGNFVEVNQVACDRLGYTRAELLSMGIQGINDPNFVVPSRGTEKSFSERKMAIFEMAHRRKDGTVIPVELNARMIDYNGQPVVLTVARDITDRKKAQAENQQRNLELDRLYRQAEERANRIAVSNEIIRAVSAGRTLDEVFQTFVEQSHKLISSDRISLALLDLTNSTVLVYARLVEGVIERQPELVVPLDGAAYEIVTKSHRPLIAPDLRDEQRFQMSNKDLIQAGFLSSLYVPIVWKDKVLGTLNLHSRKVNAFSEADGEILMPVARQFAVAIENTQLQAQIQEMAIREERDRLGRELHDGVGQVLGYFQIKLVELAKMLSADKFEDARRVVAELDQAAHTAYTDVREAILGLRATVTAGVGLEPVLREYLATYQREWGLVTKLIVEGTANGSGLTPAAEIQLLRIIQEALTNVRKHARASRVDVRLEHDTSGVLVTIADDGCGFDPEQPHREHFGLQIMRERTESVGGNFEIASTPGQGTCIRLHLPCQHVNRNDK